MLQDLITDESAWKATDLPKMDWTITLDEAELAELDQAVSAVKAKGFVGRDFGRGDFPLAGLRLRLEEALACVKEGPGVALIRGIPIERYNPAEIEILYWGIGVHLGLPMGQNRRGERVGIVQAEPEADPYSEAVRRGYQRPSALPFHADSTDVVGLLCVRKARSGGLSLIASMTAIHNHILTHRPDLLPPLYEGMHTAVGEDGAARCANAVSPWRIPIFEYHNGHLNSFFAMPRYLAAQKCSGKDFTPLQIEALQYVDDLARSEEFHYAMDLQPGDIQLLNNYVVLHSRTHYEDFEEPERARRLLRLWLRLDEEDYRLSPHRAHIFRWGMDPVRATMV